MKDKVNKFLIDVGIEFMEFDNEFLIYKDINYSDSELVVLSKFWSMPIVKIENQKWLINDFIVRRV